jgi:Uracil DNA glycosylase superfamily
LASPPLAEARGRYQHGLPNVGPKDDRDLLSEHDISWNHYIAWFRRSSSSEGGSRFGFGAMRSAAVLLDMLDHQPVRGRQEPSELVETVLRTARLQAIKCTPRRDRSKPYPEMWEECPSFLLGGELDIVRPSVLLVLGKQPRDVVAELDGFDPCPTRRAGLHRGVLHGDGWQADVYALSHPTHSLAGASQAAFARSLRANRGRGQSA